MFHQQDAAKAKLQGKVTTGSTRKQYQIITGILKTIVVVIVVVAVIIIVIVIVIIVIFIGIIVVIIVVIVTNKHTNIVK